MMDKLQRYETYDKRIWEETVCLDDDVSALEAENERLKSENEMLKCATVAPTDSGIVNFDSMCAEFNEGKRSMASLCFSLWNTSRLQK